MLIRSLSTTNLRPVVDASAVVAVGVIPAFLTGASVVQIRGEFDVPPAALGVLVGLFFGSSAIASGPAGRLVERIGSWSGMRLSAVGASLSLGGVALLAHDLPSLGALLVVGGLANSIANPAANLVLVESVPAHRRALALGVKQAAIPSATLLAGLSIPLLALTLGWRTAFASAAVIAMLIALECWSRDRATRAGSRSRGRRPAGATNAGSARRVTAFLAAGATLGIWGGQAMGTFLVSYGVDLGLTAAEAGLLLTIASLAGIASRVIAGWIVDRRRGTGVDELAIMLGIGTLGLLLLAVGSPPLAVVGAIPAFAGGWGWSGVLAFVVIRANPDAPAAATGITQAGVFVGATIGVPAFGIITEATSYQAAWVATATSALIALLIVKMAGRRIDAGPT